jgi:hypothetical protein
VTLAAAPRGPREAGATVTRVVLVIAAEGGSVEALEWLLLGSPFRVLAEQPSATGGDELYGGAPAHRARELLNRVSMLTCCLQLPDVTDDEWGRWPAEIADANRRLEALYAAGLSRDFLGEPTRRRRRPEGGTA